MGDRGHMKAKQYKFTTITASFGNLLQHLSLGYLVYCFKREFGITQDCNLIQTLWLFKMYQITLMQFQKNLKLKYPIK